MWRYPEPGLINPATKMTKTVDDNSDWGSTQDWHLVPGTWTLEVWESECKLVTQQFQLIEP
jgi:hypothetical protein